mgnify:CR=1 FL=1|tara:strand:- start:760 stop:1563 length:804 start_codon:yes stop_codon:yes gene_type:complete
MFIEKKPKKSLGQNFLIDKNIIKKIINLGNIEENKTILEIGAGYGSLTTQLAKKYPKKILAIEKDKALSLILKKKLKFFDNVKVINDDIFNFITNNKLDKNIIVFGNLPYNIATKILTSLVLIKKWPPWFNLLILMFQKEVADRIIAKHKSKEFGRLSVLCNWRLEIKKHFDVSKNCFYPKPDVNSSVLTFKPRESEFFFKNSNNLENVTRILFSNRRKMINKNFIKLFGKNSEVAKKLNLNLKLRPEELNHNMYYKIVTEYEKLIY